MQILMVSLNGMEKMVVFHPGQVKATNQSMELNRKFYKKLYLSSRDPKNRQKCAVTIYLLQYKLPMIADEIFRTIGKKQ